MFISYYFTFLYIYYYYLYSFHLILFYSLDVLLDTLSVVS